MKNDNTLRATFRLLVFTSALLAANVGLGSEIVLIQRPLSEGDTRYAYGDKLLAMILEATEEDFGPATLQMTERPTTRNRTLEELKAGEALHVTHAATKLDWEEQVIPIRIPTSKGIGGYRILLIKKSSQEELSKITTLDQLKQVPTGAGSQWQTASIFSSEGFNLVTGNNYEGLFQMLMRDRFKTFGRGLTEAFTEYEERKEQYPELAIEKDLLIYYHLPVYFFVTPKKPELAKRIETGFLRIIDDGSFDAYFMSEVGDLIEKANLKGRRLFTIPNPLLSPETPLDEEKFWYTPE